MKGGLATMLKAFGLDLSPEGVRAMLQEYGVNYDEIVTLIPRMAVTLDEFNARLIRVEQAQAQILSLLEITNVSNNTGTDWPLGTRNALIHRDGNSAK